MNLLRKEKVNGFNFYYYDRDWQEPVITEKKNI